MRRSMAFDALSLGGMPVLAVALLLPAFHGCSNDDPRGPGAGRRAEGGATGGTGGGDGSDAGDLGDVSDASTGTGGAIPPISTEPDARVIDIACVDSGAPPDPRYEWRSTRSPKACCDFFVDLPSEGTPASVDAICGDAADGATASGWAARVKLTGNPKFSTAGTIDVSSALSDRVIGLPTIALVDASPAEWGDIVLTPMRTKSFGGYEFDVSWSNVPPFLLGARLTFEITFVVRCGDDAGAPSDGPEATRTVKALTHLALCGFSLSASGWISSGDLCRTCGENGGELAPNTGSR